MSFSPNFPYSISGVASLVATPTPIEQWALQMKIPDHTLEGKFIDGRFISRLFGIESKSWNRKTFSRTQPIVEVARQALDRAKMHPQDVDSFIIVTSTPFHLHFDLDFFDFSTALCLRKDLPPLILSAGCAGLSRAYQLLKHSLPKNALILMYNCVSPLMSLADGSINPLYLSKDLPRQKKWYTPATFSDGASAMVLRKEAHNLGLVMYQQDRYWEKSKLGESYLVDYAGGSVLYPPGTDRDQSFFDVCLAAATKYYKYGMDRNHSDLLTHAPQLFEKIQKYYVHQTGPRAVQSFYDQKETRMALQHHQAVTLGNLSCPSGPTMLDKDMAEGQIENHDWVAFSMLGTGPERGVSLLQVKTVS